MKNTTSRTTNEIARLDKFVTVSSDAKTALNVTMVYEDDETREWAREAFERVAKIAGEQPVRPTWWRLSNLSQPGVLAAASSTAMRADVIILAVRAAEGLPLPFYAWLNAWSQNRLQLNGVLLAMLGTPQLKNKRSGRVCDFLKTIAKQARLQLLLETRNCNTWPSTTDLDNREASLSLRF